MSGLVKARLDDPYEPRLDGLKIKNGDYSQKEGRGDLFKTGHGSAQRIRQARAEIRAPLPSSSVGCLT
jgi:hypothetical protein